MRLEEKIKGIGRWLIHTTKSSRQKCPAKYSRNHGGYLQCIQAQQSQWQLQ